MNTKGTTLQEYFPSDAKTTIFNFTSPELDNNSDLVSINFSHLKVKPTLICFSHLRWDFVFQRPQHLLTRFAAQLDVVFIEEPIFDVHDEKDFINRQTRDQNVTVLTPHLSCNRSFEYDEQVLSVLIENYLEEENISDVIAWYYTPMALGFTQFLKPLLTIYDCMDELSAFVGAPPELKEREARLFKLADLVFTGGVSLYEAKRHLHENIYAFPSSIEVDHFKEARRVSKDPADQINIPYPRIGFFGVIDERMDIELVGKISQLRPDWQFVFIGPVVKVDPAKLPKSPNIHYLGMKHYKELPSYISNWNIAMMPFALNESTKFISPTKTPEYLASGKPVVSSAITDVVETYGSKGLVNIYRTESEFIDAVETALCQKKDKNWLYAVDNELSKNSWNLTSDKMIGLMAHKISAKIIH